MIFTNNDFGVGGKVNFLQKRTLYSWIQKSPLWTRKLSSKYLHSNKVDIRNAFWDLNTYMTKGRPSWNSGEQPPPPPPPQKKKKKKKNRNSLISISNYQRYTKFNSMHVFLRMTKRMNYSKIKLGFTKVVKIEDGSQLWSKNCSWYKIN